MASPALTASPFLRELVQSKSLVRRYDSWNGGTAIFILHYFVAWAHRPRLANRSLIPAK